MIRYTVCCIARHDEYCYIEAFSGIARSSQGNTVARVAPGILAQCHSHNRHWRDLQNWKVSDAAHPFG